MKPRINTKINSPDLVKLRTEQARGLKDKAENHRTAKLTLAQVRRIRSEFAKGVDPKERARFYNITPCQYSKIGRRRAWESVE